MTEREELVKWLSGHIREATDCGKDYEVNKRDIERVLDNLRQGKTVFILTDQPEDFPSKE